MPHRLLLAIAAAAALMASGCTNSLYFYETGKFSLTLEARPDSTQPVQGNVGFKQRTAVINPPTTFSENKYADTASMISSFRLKKDNTWHGWGPVHIRTGLVTGAAARCLTDDETQRVAVAVTGQLIPPAGKIADLAINTARENGKGDVLAALARKPWSELTPAERADIQFFTGMGENYDSDLHEEVRKKLGS